MPLVIVAVSVALLVLMMTRFKLNGFVSLLIVSVLVGLFASWTKTLMFSDKPANLSAIGKIIESGVGGQMKGTLLTIGIGAMIGRLLADAGAAQRIATKMVNAFGERGIQWAMVVTSVVIGITMFYEVAFVIIVPVAFTLVSTMKKNLLWVGLPMSITLSTMHSFLPPHPGPVAVAGLYNASVGKTLAIGLIFAIPFGALIAMVWPRLGFIKKMNPDVPAGLVTDKVFTEEEMPPMWMSLAIAGLPVVLIAGSAIVDMATKSTAAWKHAVDFVGESSVALLITLMLAIILLGPVRGRSIKDLGESMASAGKAMAMILLVIAAGGAFKSILTAAGVAQYIADITAKWHINALVLAWVIAVILRIALGSATVAVSTAAGIAAPLVAASGISPELAVLATSCGSIAFSHVNDPGFWMFKEYFNLSVTDAIKARTSYTTVLSILGLGGVMLLSLFIG